ncbi:MAG: sulfatase-like hydrolase/transferase [Pseudotabrizicola sp.]|uniref:phosphoethanolamine transferase n=1 Tax=Pseudotabrizicola sp. TaxID=2939647 RepID=UPI002723E64A|nr:sulfatase-like hydrolase/transferase [Pseudotabrizicola sp.]MDO8882695.1 sulfatase-like hydrolase/transferase [Pseudotabrizicola sp.]MDP2079720.1 sulfatase-like hydrolase/transferase [Pseudotabrizicola sp.]MDZ7575693.1 sulfatase-like hydrolase/transferase [Pseudotabrizicola sp.]
MTELTNPRNPLSLWRPELGQTALTLVVASYIMAVLNAGFWDRVTLIFPQSFGQRALFGFGVWALTVLLLELFGPWRLQRPVAALLILIAAGAHYYERNFGVLIDREMVRNVFETTMTESRHLITGSAIFQISLTGILPAALVFWPKVRHVGVWHQLWRWPLGVMLGFALMVGALFGDYKAYSAALREHHDLMGAYQPGASLNAVLRYTREQWKTADPIVQPLGTDARPSPVLASTDKPVLLVIFAGETARAQNFGLNGYVRDTTPNLRAHDVINFADTSACGTSTAVSLPCMFSRLTQAEYSRDAFLSEENLLDVLTHAGMVVEWHDNNTGDQRIATRTGWARVDATPDPEACAIECTDEVFLPLIADRLATITQNTVLVLHMIGSHGPAYHLRYPPARANFQPECKTSQFSACTVEEIVNSYDNTILETDFVLSRTIDMMQASDRVHSAMIFLSDHGESLGEDGLYLHAAPRFMAPETQTKVPFVLWMGQGFQSAMRLDRDCLRDASFNPVSHDNLFHSVLGLLDLTTTVRDPALDLFGTCRNGDPS